MPLPAFAHVLETANSIGAVLHVEPHDDPIAGQPSKIRFAVTDKSGRFQAKQCNCTLTISRDGSSQSYSPTLLDQSSVTFSATFPEKAVYTLTLTGNPQEDGSFTPFTLNFTQRVDRTVGEKQGAVGFINEHFLHLLPFLIGTAWLLIAVRQENKKQSTLSPSNPSR